MSFLKISLLSVVAFRFNRTVLSMPHREFSLFLLYSLIAFGMHHYTELAIFEYSLKPIETFLHEGAHGIATLLTGNQIEAFHLEWREGHVLSSFAHGGRIDRIIVGLAGYVGASVFGFTIYTATLWPRLARAMKLVLIMMVTYFSIYADGLNTLFMLAFVAGVFVLCWLMNTWGVYLLRFIGVFVMISAIYTPTYLWAYDRSGDHIFMSKLTFLPSSIFILLWVAVSILLLWLAYRVTPTKIQP